MSGDATLDLSAPTSVACARILVVQSRDHSKAITLSPMLPGPATTISSAVDRAVGVVAEETSHETLIGDLAFEQVSSGTRKDSQGGSLFN